ncbi:MFS transporter [Morganella psychrotolerans]|uniref:MFS transporter n=1 Tax=Morganella psychrotolerans TaxID=368603 RepID=UPI0039AF530E
MIHNTSAPRHDSVLIPVAGLTLFAIASGYLMSLIPLSLGSFAIGSEYAGWLASAYYVGLLLGSMLIEPVIARIGHRRSFILFALALAATVVILPFYTELSAWLVSRLLAGFAVAGIFVVIESWLLIGDNPAIRAKRLSFYMTALYGGTTLGQLAIGVFGTAGVVPFAVVIAVLLIAVLPLLFSDAQPDCHGGHKNLSLKQIFRLSKPAMVGCMTSGIVMGTIYGLMPLALQEKQYNTEQVGGLMAAIILGGMIIQPVISKLSSRMSKVLLLAMVSLLGVFAMGIIYISGHYLVMVAGLALLGMSSFALYPVAITLACDTLTANVIVAATQVMLFCYSIGSAAGPLVAGKLMKQPDGIMNFFFIVLLSTAIYMLLSAVRRKSRILAS